MQSFLFLYQAYMNKFLILLAPLLLLSACGENEAAHANKKASQASNVEISLRLARASEAAGDFPAAEKLFREAMEKDSGEEARIELVEFYKRHQGQRQALKLLSDSLKNDPENTDILRMIANIKIDAGESEQALKMLDDAIKYDPEYGLLYNSRGVAMDMLARHKAARDDYEKAISLDNENATIFKSNLAMSYIMTEYYSKAIHLLEPLADSSESTPSVRQNLALAYGLKGDKVNAKKYGLKDLNEKQVNENIRFYNLIENKVHGSKKATAQAIVKSEKIHTIPLIPALPENN